MLQRKEDGSKQNYSMYEKSSPRIKERDDFLYAKMKRPADLLC